MNRIAIAVLALSALSGCGLSQGSDSEPKMIDLKGGAFMMGAPADADAQQGKPQHQVTIKPFRMGELIDMVASLLESAPGAVTAPS